MCINLQEIRITILVNPESSESRENSFFLYCGTSAGYPNTAIADK